MLAAVLCVLCVQFGRIVMNNTQHAGAAETHRVFSFLEDECVSVTECLKSLRSPDGPLRTVSVTCTPSAMVVHIKANLFDPRVPVNPEYITLGERCGVTKASSEEFIIHTALTDCGTHYGLTADSLVYTNILVYAPVPSVHGVMRQEKMSVPVQCVYRRRFSVDSVSVVPTWLPHLSTHSAEHPLHFTLRLMDTDWQAMRGGMYFLGDMINMEVSVFAPLLELRVFVQDCVATTTRDVKSVPRYPFIQNGCFTDGQQASSTSRFLPRIQSDKLHLQLHTFIFRQVHSTQIFISCSLKADLQSSSSSRACSYIQGSWRSADGDHSVCESCQMSDQFRPKWIETQNTQASSVQMELGDPELQTPGSMWNPEQGDTHVLTQEVRVGPRPLSSWWSDLSLPAALEEARITYIPSLKTEWLTAPTLQKNGSMLGSEYKLPIMQEKVERESSVPAEREMTLVTPTPELGLMLAPLKTINSVFETKPAAVIPEPSDDAVSHSDHGADEVPDGMELKWEGQDWKPDTPSPDHTALD